MPHSHIPLILYKTSSTLRYKLPAELLNIELFKSFGELYKRIANLNLPQTRKLNLVILYRL